MVLRSIARLRALLHIGRSLHHCHRVWIHLDLSIRSSSASLTCLGNLEVGNRDRREEAGSLAVGSQLEVHLCLGTQQAVHQEYQHLGSLVRPHLPPVPADPRLCLPVSQCPALPPSPLVALHLVRLHPISPQDPKVVARRLSTIRRLRLE